MAAAAPGAVALAPHLVVRAQHVLDALVGRGEPCDEWRNQEASATLTTIYCHPSCGLCGVWRTIVEPHGRAQLSEIPPLGPVAAAAGGGGAVQVFSEGGDCLPAPHARSLRNERVSAPHPWWPRPRARCCCIRSGTDERGKRRTQRTDKAGLFVSSYHSACRGWAGSESAPAPK